jgi:error-prone DNA polymerase
MGVTVLPPDVNASHWRCTGKDATLRVGFQFIKGLTAEGAEALVAERDRSGPYASLADLRARTALRPDDLRLLVKVGACDRIADGMNRPQMLWAIDTANGAPALRDYPPLRKREDAWALLGFCTDAHPMTLHANELQRFRLVRSTALHQHVGKRVLMAGMYTTGKPVHTARHEPMQFATFDDGHGLVECVLFPDVYRERSHVLFDQGPFIFRGVVEESFGAVTVTLTHLERLERMLARMS